MLFAVINNVHYPIIEGNINWSLSAVSNFNFTILANEIDYKNVLYKNVEIIYNGESLIQGYIDKRPTINVTNSENIKINLSGADNLGRLACMNSRQNTHFQNSTLSSALSTLIASASGWTVTIDTVSLGNQLVTLDLRNKETLFSQLTELISIIPGAFFRYGGMVGGNHVLEVGVFGALTTYANSGFNILSLSLEPQEDKYYSEVRGYTGEAKNNVGVERVYGLNFAQTDTRYTTNPLNVQFPIVTVAGVGYVVRNNNFLNGCAVTKYFSDIAPEDKSVNTTLAIRNDMSYMLYLACVRFLKENDLSNIYNLSISNEFIPKLGDKVRVNMNIDEQVFSDTFAANHSSVSVFNADGDYRIVNISLNLAEIVNRQVDYGEVCSEYVLNLTATDSDGLVYYDKELKLYNRLMKKMQTVITPNNTA